MSKQSFAAWVDGEDFDALAYSYRATPVTQPALVALAFHELRSTIKGKHMLEVAKLETDRAELVDACKYARTAIDPLDDKYLHDKLTALLARLEADK